MIDVENLKVGLLWYGKNGFDVDKASKAFERRFEQLPDTVYCNKENLTEDFGNLNAIESSNRIKDSYLLCRIEKEEKPKSKPKLGNDLQQMMLI